jgi:hypothetical protein
LEVAQASEAGKAEKEGMKLTVPMIPPSGNVLRRQYRHLMAYKRLREAWQRSLSTPHVHRWGHSRTGSYDGFRLRVCG